jgi:hypothetical protein
MTPVLRRSLWVFLTIAGLIGVLWAWVDRSGARRLREAEAMLAKEGQTLDFRAVAPDPIPDDENFCAIPLLKDLSIVIDDDSDKGEPATRRKRIRALSLPYWSSDQRRTMDGAAFGERADLKEWAAWMREKTSLPMHADSGDAGRDILAGFSQQEPVFAELAAGIARQHAQWTPAWKAARELQEELQGVRKEVVAHTSSIVTHSSLIVTIVFAPATASQISRVLYTQSLANQAIIACALERYRIEKGSYPESLKGVKLADGKALPLDIMTGKPVGYRKTPNGKYALWSVAGNGKDHGGKRLLDRKKPESTQFWKDSYAGDWVWDFPEK